MYEKINDKEMLFNQPGYMQRVIMSRHGHNDFWGSGKSRPA
jgi:hypothetical protein